MTETNKKIILLNENGTNGVENSVLLDNYQELEDVNFMVNITALSDTQKDKLQPRALLQLRSKEARNSSTPDVITMDFKLDELTKFYETLENIQDKLDELQKK